MYEPDPFAARKSVEERQEKATKKREKIEQAATRPAPRTEPDPFDDSPEVKLSAELRELLENAIKTVLISSCHDSYQYTYPQNRQLQTARRMKMLPL